MSISDSTHVYMHMHCLHTYAGYLPFSLNISGAMSLVSQYRQPFHQEEHFYILELCRL